MLPRAITELCGMTQLLRGNLTGDPYALRPSVALRSRKTLEFELGATLPQTKIRHDERTREPRRDDECQTEPKRVDKLLHVRETQHQGGEQKPPQSGIGRAGKTLECWMPKIL